MIKVQQLHNRIFQAGLALLLAILMLAALPASAAEPVHAVDGAADSHGAQTITLPFRQEWTGDGDQTVTYAITSVGDDARCTYTFAEDTANGTLTGNATGHIIYNWTNPGLYMFDLTVTTADRANYTYDHTSYRIRVYARNSISFVTVENLSITDATSDGKVNEIVYHHTYTAPNNNNPGGTDGGDGGSNGGSSNGGGSTSTSGSGSATNTNNTETVITISESGDNGTILEDLIQYISEWGNEDNGTGVAAAGNHRNAYTGDDSQMILYGSVSILAIITLAVWFIRRKRA